MTDKEFEILSQTWKEPNPEPTTLPQSPITLEQFDSIKDLRMYLRMSMIDRTTDCVHYLGNKAQIWYHLNGWRAYRYKYNYDIVSEIPPVTGRYMVLRKDGKVHFATWNGTGWAYNDNDIIGWQEVPKKPKDW